jgi:hypothetical protein
MAKRKHSSPHESRKPAPKLLQAEAYRYRRQYEKRLAGPITLGLLGPANTYAITATAVAYVLLIRLPLRAPDQILAEVIGPPEINVKQPD